MIGLQSEGSRVFVLMLFHFLPGLCAGLFLFEEIFQLAGLSRRDLRKLFDPCPKIGRKDQSSSAAFHGTKLLGLDRFVE
jgi:hypothetical protein